MFARLRCGGNLPLCLAFGTGEGHLWYGICVPCQKQHLPTGRIFSARNGPRSEVSKYKKRVRLKALVGPPFFPVLPEQLLCAELYSLMHLTEYASALLPAPLADAVMPFASVLKARQANPNPVALVSSLVFGELLQ